MAAHGTQQSSRGWSRWSSYQSCSAVSPPRLWTSRSEVLGGSGEYCQPAWDNPHPTLLGTRHLPSYPPAVGFPAKDVVAAGAVPLLTDLLPIQGSCRLQFEAAWALVNVTASDSECTLAVVQAGAVPLFVHLLASPCVDVAEQGAWGVGNIAGESPVCRDVCLAAGALSGAVALLGRSSLTDACRRTTVWAMGNLIRGQPPPSFLRVQEALPAVLAHLRCKDPEAQLDACWCAAYLVRVGPEAVGALATASWAPLLLGLLKDPGLSDTRSPILQVLQALAKHSVEVAGILVAGALIETLLERGPLQDSLELLGTLFTPQEPGRVLRALACGLMSKVAEPLVEEGLHMVDGNAWVIVRAARASDHPELHAFLGRGDVLMRLCQLTQTAKDQWVGDIARVVHQQLALEVSGVMDPCQLPRGHIAGAVNLAVRIEERLAREAPLCEELRFALEELRDLFCAYYQPESPQYKARLRWSPIRVGWMTAAVQASIAKHAV